MDNSEVKSILLQAIDCMDFIQKQHSCNDCRRNKFCDHVPKAGEMVRINCYSWEGKSRRQQADDNKRHDKA